VNHYQEFELVSNSVVSGFKKIWLTQRILEVFPNPAPQRAYVIEHTHHEFNDVDHRSSDFATIQVRYVADKTCVELKSLKLYFHAFRNDGIFFRL